MATVNPTCRDCQFLRAYRRGYATRYSCYCYHGNAEEVFRSVCPESNRQPGFIGFSKPGKLSPDIKTRPKWCPLADNNKEV